VVVGIIEVQMGDLPDTKQYISVMASVGVTCLRYMACRTAILRG